MESTSEFINRHTINNGKGFNIIEAINELYSRIISLQNSVKSIHEALGDYGTFSIEVEKRLNELEGKKTIQIISESDAKIILK